MRELLCSLLLSEYKYFYASNGNEVFKRENELILILLNITQRST